LCHDDPTGDHRTTQPTHNAQPTSSSMYEVKATKKYMVFCFVFNLQKKLPASTSPSLHTSLFYLQRPSSIPVREEQIKSPLHYPFSC
jgi:hypothetical protein